MADQKAAAGAGSIMAAGAAAAPEPTTAVEARTVLCDAKRVQHLDASAISKLLMLADWPPSRIHQWSAEMRVGVTIDYKVVAKEGGGEGGDKKGDEGGTEKRAAALVQRCLHVAHVLITIYKLQKHPKVNLEDVHNSDLHVEVAQICMTKGADAAISLVEQRAREACGHGIPYEAPQRKSDKIAMDYVRLVCRDIHNKK